MLQRAATRLYYCAPLLVRLALEDGERGALGIAKDGDLAGREIQGSGQHGSAKPARLLHGGVARRDREVREPEGWSVYALLRHRHETYSQPADAEGGAGLSDKRFASKKERSQRLDIEELDVGRLHVRELVVERGNN